MKKLQQTASTIALALACLLAAPNTTWAQSQDLAEAHRLFDTGKYKQAQNKFETAGYSGNADAQLFLGNFHYYGMGDKVDKVKAAYWYELAAQNGFVSAMLLYGGMLENGDGIDQSYAMARHWYDKAAKTGNAQGQTLLAKIDAKILHAQGNTKADGFYDTAQSSSQASPQATFETAQKLYKDCDYAGAFTALTQVAQSGDSRAHNTLGDMYRMGQYVKKSPTKALDYYKRGGDAKDPLALLNLGLMYEQGMGTPQNYELAAKYYQLAVEGDSDRARAYLGELYETGKGVKKNLRSARFLYGVAARSGDSYATKQLNRLDAASAPKAPVSQIVRATNTAVKPVPKIDVGPPYQPQPYTARSENLANLADERIVKAFHDKKYAQVRGEIKTFVDQGMARHQVIMGKTYFQEKNYAEAMKWYKRAAAAENKGTAWIYIQEAQYLVGAMYNLGFGAPYDVNIAAGWFTLAIDYTLPNKQAAFELGRMYEQGKYIPLDEDKAMDMYTKAGKKNSEALFRLGYLYEKNYKQNYIYKRFAVEKYQQSAGLDNATGQFALGMAYYGGKLTDQSFAKAHEWLGKSAAQGNADAQTNLGVMYMKGEGTSQNIAMAKSWLKKAAAQGQENAIAILKDLE